MNLAARFNTLDENLKLDPAVRAEVERLHNEIGALLVAAGVAKRSRLQGSLARHTMRGPDLHDVDKVIELTDQLRDLLETPCGTEQAMSMIRQALDPHYPGATFEVKKHALAIGLPNTTIGFDGVPAFNLEESSGWIRIANTEDDTWIPSNTYTLIETIAKRNQQCDGRFVRQVRMIKQAVHHAGLDDCLPGLHVEAFAYSVISNALPHNKAVAGSFAAASRMLGTTYSDPTGVDCISDRLEPSQVPRAREVMLELSRLAEQANEHAEAGEEDEAGRIWADIFGPLFPQPADADEKKFLQDLHLGAGAISGKLNTPTTRAWRPE